MAQRGSCAKGIAKREEILSTALDLVARVGYSRTTVREIAQAVGLSQTGLLHYFGARNSSSSRSCAAAARSTSKCSAWSTTQADPHWPTCHARSPRWHATMPKFRGSSSSTHASPPKRPSPSTWPTHTSVTATPSSVLRRQPRSGSTRPTAPSLPPWTPTGSAVMLFALLDGLQTQWMYDSEIDMVDQLDYVWTLLLNTPDGDRQRPVETSP
ncbi:TetR family transcriptional regulator [Streptomyces sp. KL116D]|uniref:TetR/AcrR family transcriptional regulator n=1 Tax=Streptomyces sp. KL116D TaxID=3045152 RepID=UPI0035565183